MKTIDTDIPEYKFNFPEAVAKAKRDYPELTKNVVFLDLADRDVRTQLAQALTKISPPPAPDQIAEFMKDFDRLEKSDGFVANCGQTPFLFASSRPQLGFFARNHQEKAAAYTFAHELGHLVVKEGRVSKQGAPAEALYAENLSENVADSFAVLTGLHEGWLSKKEILRISLERAVNGWISKDLDHITIFSLDNIIIRAEDIVSPSLSPAEISMIAHQHAREFTLASGTMRYLFNELASLGPFDKLKALEQQQALMFESADSQKEIVDGMISAINTHAKIIADACLDEPANSAGFHLYGRIVAKILRTGTIEGVPIDTKNDYWDKVKRDLVTKSYAAGLSEIFAIEHPDVQKPATPRQPVTQRSNHFKNQI